MGSFQDSEPAQSAPEAQDPEKVPSTPDGGSGKLKVRAPSWLMKQARDVTHFLICDNRGKAWGILLECGGSSVLGQVRKRGQGHAKEPKCLSGHLGPDASSCMTVQVMQAPASQFPPV